jgi:excisionase family DNA binding protein
MEPLLLGLKEAGELLSLGKAKVRELVSSGDIPHVRIGKRILIPATALRLWAEGLTREEKE